MLLDFSEINSQLFTIDFGVISDIKGCTSCVRSPVLGHLYRQICDTQHDERPGMEARRTESAECY